MASSPTSTITSTTTSNFPIWFAEPEGGSSKELRRSLISLSRNHEAFWWLPDFKDQIYVCQNPEKQLLAIVRPIGPFWEWVRFSSSINDNITLPKELPKDTTILSIKKEGIPLGTTLGKRGYLGMFQPSENEILKSQKVEGQPMCSFLFTDTSRPEHPGYPKPMMAFKINSTLTL